VPVSLVKWDRELVFIAASGISNNARAVRSQSQNGDIDLLALFSQLIDESRRRNAIHQIGEMVMTTQARPTRPIRPKCQHCQKPGHQADKCWEKHPHLKNQAKVEPRNTQNQSERPSREAYMAEEEIASTPRFRRI